MKKIYPYFILLLVLLFTFSHCKKQQPKDNFIILAENYLTNELHVAHFDSVIIEKVDTVYESEYAEIMTVILQQMNAEMLMNYQTVLQDGDDEKTAQIEKELDEIAAAGEYWESYVANMPEGRGPLMYYLLTATYYTQNTADQFQFFVTAEKDNYHILAPLEE